MPNNHSNTDVVGPEILACSGGHSTHQFAPPSVEKFGLENARKAFANASKISHPVTTRAAGNRFMLATDEHVVVDSGGEECISAGNIWRVNRLDRGHDPVMVTEVQHRTGSGHEAPFARGVARTFRRRLRPVNGRPRNSNDPRRPEAFASDRSRSPESGKQTGHRLDTRLRFPTTA